MNGSGHSRRDQRRPDLGLSERPVRAEAKESWSKRRRLRQYDSMERRHAGDRLLVSRARQPNARGGRALAIAGSQAVDYAIEDESQDFVRRAHLQRGVCLHRCHCWYWFVGISP